MLMSSTKTAWTPGCCSTAPAPSACTTSWVGSSLCLIHVLQVGLSTEKEKKNTKKTVSGKHVTLAKKIFVCACSILYILSVVGFGRDRAAGPEDQTAAESRAKPGFPPPSSLQWPKEPPLPSTCCPLLSEAPVSSWAFWTLPFAGPLQRLFSKGRPISTIPH